MRYCNDFEKRLERHTAFWHKEIVDRCLCSVTSLRDGGSFDHFPLPSNPEDRLAYWTDGELILNRYLSWFKNTYYGGDSLPILIHDLGPAGHAGYFKGVTPRFENTVWFDSEIKNYDDIVFDPNSFLYKKTIELAKLYCSVAKGDFIVSMPDAVGIADVLSHLLTPETFLIDMLDTPDLIMKSLQNIQIVWEKIYTEVFEIVKANNYGGSSVGWLGTWAPGILGQLQCDLSVMISPSLFEDLILYELQTQAKWLDHSIYHLDGWQQIKHLELILSVKELDAIQWTNVAGQPGPLHFVPEFKRIQQAGKNLIIHIDSTDVPTLMEQLSSQGLYILTYTDTQGEAIELEKLIAKLTND
jgi:hypothetical protein